MSGRYILVRTREKGGNTTHAYVYDSLRPDTEDRIAKRVNSKQRDVISVTEQGHPNTFDKWAWIYGKRNKNR